jgi:hypothetical protein
MILGVFKLLVKNSTSLEYDENCMRRSVRAATYSSMIAVAAFVLVSPLLAQNNSCKRFLIENSQLPHYPPIAHAAHMEATIRFKISVPVTGEPEITFLDGPSKGVWQTLVSNARDYLAGRKYGWFEGGRPEACSYIASVEYRIIPGEIDAPNNFIRVTVFDEKRTLIEVKPTVLTTNY